MSRPPRSLSRHLPALGLLLFLAAGWIGFVQTRFNPRIPTPEPTPARIATRADAPFPGDLARLGIEGEVNVEFTVDAHGRPIHPRVVQQSNHGFVRPALEALAASTFKPATKDGYAMASRMELSFAFRIEHDGGDDSDTGLWKVKPPATWDASVPENFRFDDAPHLRGAEFAVYPRAQLEAGEKARVDMGLVVDPTGRIVRMSVLNADAPDWAVLAARAMYGAWKLDPARRRDEPCYAGVRTSLVFDPRGSDSVPVGADLQALLRELAKPAPAIVALEDLDTPPEPYFHEQPATADWLPPAAAHGRVVVEYFIDPRGEVLLPTVVSTPNPELGAFAAQTVQAWVFAPPLKAGRSTTARARVPLEY